VTCEFPGRTSVRLRVTQRIGLGMATSSSHHRVKDGDYWMPLFLSLMAGLSTSLGASVVFLARRKPSEKKKSQQQKSSSTSTDSESSSDIISHKHMSFSLALAGSVMVTVSFFSLLPESFRIDEEDAPSDAGGFTQQRESYSYLSVTSSTFWNRVVSFVVGCALYWLLSKCAFPEPDELIARSDEDASEVQTQSKVDDRSGQGNRDVERGRNSSPDRSNSENEEPYDLLLGKLPDRKSSKRPSTASRKLRMRSLSSIADNDKDEDNSSSDTQPLLPSSKETGGENGTDSDGSPRRWTSVASCCIRGWRRMINRQFTSGADLTTVEARRAWRVAMLLFVSLAVHNFPEGFAVAASSIHSPKLGFTTAIAIAFHNIPEGIAIAIPCLAARPDSPWLAFGLATLSGLAEPLGAVVALLALHRHVDKTREGADSDSTAALSTKTILSFVAGIMTTVAIMELFPEAIRHSSSEEKGRRPLIAGSLLGAFIMIASDAILEGSA